MLARTVFHPAYTKKPCRIHDTKLFYTLHSPKSKVFSVIPIFFLSFPENLFISPNFIDFFAKCEASARKFHPSPPRFFIRFYLTLPSQKFLPRSVLCHAINSSRASSARNASFIAPGSVFIYNWLYDAIPSTPKPKEDTR